MANFPMSGDASQILGSFNRVLLHKRPFRVVQFAGLVNDLYRDEKFADVVK